MSTFLPCPNAVFQSFLPSGAANSFGQLNTYQAGTTTPQATYTDSTGGTANANPVVMNAQGQANVWLTAGQFYKLVLNDSAGNQLWSVDQVPGGGQNTPITQAIVLSLLSSVAAQLVMSGIANTYTSLLTGNATTGQSYGPLSKAGTNTSDWGFRFQNQAGTQDILSAFGDGEAFVQVPPVYTAGPSGTFQVGYLDYPPRTITGSANLLITDRGKAIVMTGTTAAQTITIQAHASVSYAPGHQTLIINKSNQNWSLAITTDTLTFLPSNGTGTRTLAAGAWAFLINDSTSGGTSWEVWGGGIT